jgi:hypothetical protein
MAGARENAPMGVMLSKPFIERVLAAFPICRAHRRHNVLLIIEAIDWLEHLGARLRIMLSKPWWAV